MPEIVYIVINEAMPGLIKIGRTNGELAARIRQLYQGQTGVPLPFEVFYACEVANSVFVEGQLHLAFDDHRISKSREFFKLRPERARAALMIAAIREITLGDEIYESPEAKEEVEIVKRRKRFQLAMISLPAGTELRLAKDNSITCVTADDVNQVVYKGEQTSLSDAALQALRDIGCDWYSVSGPWEWTYAGKRLDEIRREIEEKSD